MTAIESVRFLRSPCEELDLLGVIGIRLGDGASLDKGLEQVSLDSLKRRIQLHSLISGSTVAHQDGDLSLRLALFFLAFWDIWCGGCLLSGVIALEAF